MGESRVFLGEADGLPEWDVVVGRAFLAAVAAPADARTLAGLRRLADDPGALVEELVGVLPSVRDAPGGFALVRFDDDGPGARRVTVVVRGDAVVDLDSPGGSRRFDDRGIRPFHLADFDQVTHLLVRGSAAGLAGPRDGERVGGPGATARGRVIGWACDAAHAAADVDDETRAAGLGAAETQLVLPVPAAAPVTPARGVDVLAEPVSSGGIAAFRIGAEAVQPLDGPVYVGRRPSLPRIPAEDAPRLYAVPAALPAVSSTHVELRPVGRTVVVTDLHSRNGTTVVAPGGARRRLRGGESVVVGPGSTLDIGGTLVEILAAAQERVHEPLVDEGPGT
ncbi:FHA domain-containing protein [Agromyces sp. SYSU T00194]|uniref:FHA domain-containing protein n=1 Tax=Agromyces chitinivorans TaxID=3158560 RepID=UPI003397C0EC